jgi:hypothetical protein
VHPIEWLRAVARSGDVPQAELASEAAAALAALCDDPHGLLLACRRLLDRHPTAGALWWTCARMVSAADPASEADAVQRDLDADQVGLSLTLDLPDESCVTVPQWSALGNELASRRGDLRLLAVAPNEDRPDRAGRRGRGRRPRWSRDMDDLWMSDTLAGSAIDDGDDVDDEDDGRVQVVSPREIGAAVTDSDVVLVEAWAATAGWFLVAPGALAAASVARQRRTQVWMAVGVGRRLPDPLFAALRRRVFGRGTAALGAGADLVEPSLVDRVVEPLDIACPSAPELQRDLGGATP